MSTIDQDPETGVIALCAVRYALGRRTYMPSLVADWLKRHWNCLTEQNQRSILRDVDDEFKRAEELEDFSTIGDPCDINTWRNLRDWMKEQLGVISQ